MSSSAGAFAACAVVTSLAVSLGAQTPRVIPTRYVADRFFAAPVSQRGDTILMLMDTGGGNVFVSTSELERMGITPKFMFVEQRDSFFTGGAFPKFRDDASIPAPLGTPRGQIFGVGSGSMAELGGAGMVGHNWFAGRVWVLDYPNQRAAYYETPPAPKPFGPHTIPMTLKKPLTRDDPRIQVVVDGDTVEMLLDTGATTELTPEAIAAEGEGPKVRAGAFAAARLWDKWRSKHPDWPVVVKGEVYSKADVIRVPSVSIAGFDVGPIWFSKRPNGVYDGMMKAIMDKPVLASIGGAAFRPFRLTLDYVNQRVTFEKP